MLIKIAKSYKSFDINNFLEESGSPIEECETIEVMAKHSCDIHIDLKKLINLKRLYIYGNGSTILDISGKTQLEILKLRGIGNCDHLQINKDLPLKILQLTQCSLNTLPSWTYQLRELESLELQQNNLSSLPIEFEWLKNLRRINIDNNNFKLIPRVLANLNELNHLSCDANSITPEQLQDFIKLLNS